MDPFQNANSKAWTENDPELIFACPLPQDAEPVMRLLVLNGFQPMVTVATLPFNPNYAFSKLPDHVRLWVFREEYDEAHQVLVDQQVFAPINEVDGLLQMLAPCSDEELHQIIATEHRFPPNQIAAAKQLLTQRGISIDTLLIDRIFHAENAALRKPGFVNLLGFLVWLFLAISEPSTSVVLAIMVLFYEGRDLEGRPYGLYNPFAKACAIVLGGLSFLILSAMMLFLSKVSDDLTEGVLLCLGWLMEM